MAQGILNEERCVKAEQLADAIIGYRAKIENSVTTFNYVMTNTPEIQAWLKDTEAGKEIYEKVMYNNEALKALAENIELISHYTEQLVERSRQINSNRY